MATSANGQFLSSPVELSSLSCTGGCAVLEYVPFMENTPEYSGIKYF